VLISQEFEQFTGNANIQIDESHHAGRRPNWRRLPEEKVCEKKKSRILNWTQSLFDVRTPGK
jgi:hypothetical protein